MFEKRQFQKELNFEQIPLCFHMGEKKQHQIVYLLSLLLAMAKTANSFPLLSR